MNAPTKYDPYSSLFKTKISMKDAMYRLFATLDAPIAALQAVEWAVPTPDSENDGACPSCYAGKPVKYYVVSTEFDRKNHMKFCQLADALEQVK